MNPLGKTWLPLALTITLFSGLLYISLQQLLRQSANDPQIELSENIAANLSSGQTPDDVIQTFELIDMAKSLSPFIIIYDPQGNVINSSAQLNNRTPVVPIGVLQYAQKHHQNRITWMPQAATRHAIVVTPFQTPTKQGGYVLVGRSLREIENRSQQLLIEISLAWIATTRTNLFNSPIILILNPI